MAHKKKFIKEDFDISCLICLEKQNRVFELNKYLSELFYDILKIQLESIIKLPKRICYRCYFILEYMRDFLKVTIRNVTYAENNLIKEDYSIEYVKPIIFNIITDKILKEENIPYRLFKDTTDQKTKEMEEKKDDDVLIVPLSYRVSSQEEEEILPFKQTIFQCTNCTMTYNKKSSLVHHERKHRRQQRKERINNIQNNRSKSYSCNDCDTETIYSTISELRKHKKSHVGKYCCRMGCEQYFNASMERDNHESMCNKRFTTEELEQTGVRTRSRSRLGSVSRNSRCSSIESYLSFHKTGWSSDESGSSDSRSTSKTNTKTKRKNRYAKSCDSSISNDSTLTTDRKYKFSENSKRNKSISTMIHVSHEPRNTVRSSRPRNRNPPVKNADDNIVSDPEFLEQVNSAPVGFQPRNAAESIHYFNNYERENQPSSRKSKFKCSKCKYTNNNVDAVSQHETKRHKIEPWFPCNECRKAFTKQNLLDHHKMVSHYVGPAVCNFCSEVHANQYNLKLHVIKHRFVENYVCAACDKRYLTLEQLQDHSYCQPDETHQLFSVSLRNYGFKISDVCSLKSTSRPGTPFPSDDDGLSVDFSEQSLGSLDTEYQGDSNDQLSVDFNDQSSSLDLNDQLSSDGNGMNDEFVYENNTFERGIFEVNGQLTSVTRRVQEDIVVSSFNTSF